MVGLGLGIGGTAMKASSAKRKRAELAAAQEKWLPDIDTYTDNYFRDLLKHEGEATKLADTIGEADLARTMRLREQAMPGIGKLSGSAMEAIAPLLKGELPPGVLESFQRAGGASTVGLGMGGSGFGFLNTGMFGARGALGAMQTGFGLLPALMSTLPNINSPSSMAFLESIMTPAQRTQTQLSIRGQNLGVQSQLAGMETSKDVWGGFLQQTGGQMFGMGMAGMGGGGMGGGPGSAAGLSTAPAGTGFGSTPSSNMGYLGGANRLFNY